jgi:hypothetical protein
VLIATYNINNTEIADTANGEYQQRAGELAFRVWMLRRATMFARLSDISARRGKTIMYTRKGFNVKT